MHVSVTRVRMLAEVMRRCNAYTSCVTTRRCLAAGPGSPTVGVTRCLVVVRGSTVGLSAVRRSWGPSAAPNGMCETEKERIDAGGLPSVDLLASPLTFRPGRAPGQLSSRLRSWLEVRPLPLDLVVTQV